ncbi:MAG: cold shock domain-containing protein [Comamonadaceae bacterium]|nr:cold shock domain-containing protein [Burkholderiales bacterium]MEB2347492.1 cold shock domain-containing protein [Comamonadaceae bacterium]
MRYEGRLAQWNDERGFGFIEPAEGGDKIFVHISAFARSTALRPQPGDRLSFEIGTDPKGRKQARRVAWADRADRASPPIRRTSARRREGTAGPGFLGRAVSFLLMLAIVAGLGWKGLQWWSAQRHGQAAAPATVIESRSAPGADAPVFRCDGRQYCSQMTSCAEATFFLRNCPGVKMDGNNDGIPCEQQWCTSPFAK